MFVYSKDNPAPHSSVQGFEREAKERSHKSDRGESERDSEMAEN